MSMTITLGRSWTWTAGSRCYQLVRGQSVWTLLTSESLLLGKVRRLDFLTMDTLLDYMREEAVQYTEEIAMVLESLLEEGF